MKPSGEMIRKLVDQAVGMLKYSYAPYSDFYVGAALLGRSGTVYTGCNVESAAFGAGICAERTAFFKAVSEGETEFEAIAIVGGREGVISDFCPPCGICRQVMMEFCDPKEFQVILSNAGGELRILSLEELLPYGFGPKNL